jgi:tRNA A37 threonylcarbamoyladenosine biosynthesis protein TsaE
MKMIEKGLILIMKTYTFTSHNSSETMKFASELASTLHVGDVVVLSGELGAGKTK